MNAVHHFTGSSRRPLYNSLTRSHERVGSLRHINADNKLNKTETWVFTTLLSTGRGPTLRTLMAIAEIGWVVFIEVYQRRTSLAHTYTDRQNAPIWYKNSRASFRSYNDAQKRKRLELNNVDCFCLTRRLPARSGSIACFKKQTWSCANSTRVDRVTPYPRRVSSVGGDNLLNLKFYSMWQLAPLTIMSL